MNEDFDVLSFINSISGLSPVDFQYFYQLFKKRTVILNTDIDSSIVETVYLPLKNFEEDDSQAPITLILNCSGGSVSDGFFLANYLSTYKKKLNIIVTGYAASMAAVILCGGGKNKNITRYCYSSSYALIHDGYIALQASEAKTAADIMEFNNRVDEKIRSFILNNSNITADQYDAKNRHQWFISAKEMKELNLIDEILDSNDEI